MPILFVNVDSWICELEFEDLKGVIRFFDASNVSLFLITAVPLKRVAKGSYCDGSFGPKFNRAGTEE